MYGLGRVSADGRKVVPNAEVALYAFTGAMIDTTKPPPPQGPGQGTPDGGDPVDLGTGLVLQETDLALPDVIPLALTRTYRPGDNATHPFGIGTTHPYAIRLWSAALYVEADLVLPDGGTIHYVRTSPGTGYADAVFEHTTTPGPFYQSSLTWGSAPHPGSVARGGPAPRSAPSRPRCARRRYAA